MYREKSFIPVPSRRTSLTLILGLLVAAFGGYILIFADVGQDHDTVLHDRKVESFLHNFSEDFGNAYLRVRFDRFFFDEEVARLMKDYARNCQPLRKLFAGLLRNPDRLGFGSCLNNALSAYFIATEPAVAPSYQFRILIHEWYYETLTTFFDDFAADTSCPLLQDITWVDMNPMSFSVGARYMRPFAKTLQNTFAMGYANSSVWVNSNDSVVIPNPSDPFNTMIAHIKLIYERDGMPAFFKKKSVLTKALWQLNPTFKKLLLALWTQMLGPSERYFAVHLRRGDKIKGGEMQNISISRYSEKIHSLCGPDRNNSCPRNVFVMADEDASFEEIYSLLSPKFTVLNLPRLLNKADLDMNDYVVFSPDKVIRTVPRDNRKFWIVHTRQLILEISLLAMADQLVCTMTSNICRIAALLKGSYEGNVHSMDTVWYPY